jgi:hypothetical protein
LFFIIKNKLGIIQEIFIQKTKKFKKKKSIKTQKKEKSQIKKDVEDKKIREKLTFTKILRKKPDKSKRTDKDMIIEKPDDIKKKDRKWEIMKFFTRFKTKIKEPSKLSKEKTREYKLKPSKSEDIIDLRKQKTIMKIKRKQEKQKKKYGNIINDV